MMLNHLNVWGKLGSTSKFQLVAPLPTIKPERFMLTAVSFIPTCWLLMVIYQARKGT